MTDPKTKEAIISKAFDKWAEKKWFQVIVAILIVYLMAAPIAGPIVYNQINKQQTTESSYRRNKNNKNKLKQNVTE